MPETRLPQDQLEQIINATKVVAPKCSLPEDDVQAMHRFAQTMANGGWAKFEHVLDFGGLLMEFKRTGRKVTITALILALLGALWLGIKAKFTGGV